MVVDKEAVTDALRAQGEHDRALLAETALSRTVDLDRDAGTLHQLGLNVADLEAAAHEGDDRAEEDAGAR